MCCECQLLLCFNSLVYPLSSSSSDHPKLFSSSWGSSAAGCLQLSQLYHGEESSGVSLSHTHTINTMCSYRHFIKNANPCDPAVQDALLYNDPDYLSPFRSHLAPLFDNPKLDRELRSMLRERFPEFCSSPSPPSEGQSYTPLFHWKSCQ